jgi:alpha-glucosidase
VEDLPDEARQDPMWLRNGGTDPGRDGCRVPMPWSGTEPPFGFGDGSQPWLPQPQAWKDHTVEAESGDPASMLELYRSALRLRRGEAFGDPAAAIRWLPSPHGVLAFARGDGACYLNLSDGPVALPAGAAVLLASQPLAEGELAPDTAVWLRRRAE